MPSYGPLISFHDAEEALIEHIKPWISSYLGGRETLKGIDLGAIARPASWFTKQTFTSLPGEDRTPAVIIVSNGFADPPEKRGDGNWDAYIRLGVVGLCHGPEAADARTLAGHYQAALLAICLQQRRVVNDGLEMKLWNWEDLQLDDVDEDQTRTLAAARLEFTYQIQGFGYERDGPTTPPVDPADPGGPLPDDATVETVDIQTGVLP